MRLFPDVITRVEDPYMLHALALAERGRGATSPNPLVGCVVVRSGRIVGEGFHAQAGEAHAEINALADAGSLAHGADVYVTLEPCVHTGRTGPCVDALVAAGVRSVRVGMADPTPTAGGGAAVLRDAGIGVTFAADPSPYAELNEEWLKYVATSSPFVTVKLAVTLDGHSALRPGRGASITGPSGAEVTRRLRAAHAAVAVGARTLNADDPALTVRSPKGELADRQPLRVVFVRDTPPDLDARVFVDGSARSLIVAPEGASPGLEDLTTVTVLRYAAEAGSRGMLRSLGSLGVDSVLIEAGPRLFSSLWSDGVIDQLVVVTAGGVAGVSAPPLYTGMANVGDDRIEHVLGPVETGIVGDVSVTVWRPKDAG